MFIIQTEIDQKSMTALARMTRRTLRRGRNGPVRMLAWFVVLLEGFLTVSYIRGGFGTWLPNTLMGLFMLGCLLLEDRVNGAFALRRIPENSRTINAAFQEDSSYVHRSEAGEHWYAYSQIRLAAETRDYFVLLQDRSHGQVYRKTDFTWGGPDQFRELIRKKTGLKIQKIR